MIELETSEHKKISQPTKPLKIRLCFVLFFMRNRWLPSTFVIFPSGLVLKYNSDYETKQRGLTMSWGVSLPSSHSCRWWSSQIPQMCRSLLSPQKPPDDLEKQRRVNNNACFKEWRWYHCRSLCATLHFWVHFEKMKGEIAVALIRLNWTVLVLLEIWWDCVQNGCPCSYSPVPGRIDW